MQIINYLLIALFILDNFFTYKNAIKYKKKFPEKDYTKIETIELQRFKVQQSAIDKWDGKLPMVTGNAIPFISLGSNYTG